MHWLWLNLALGAGAFAATMIDNFVALAAQFTVTPLDRHRHLAYAQFAALMSIVALSLLVGGVLNAIPLRLVGLLAVAPLGYAWSKWSRRHQPDIEHPRRGIITTALVTLALSGDNIAVWSALFRSSGVSGGLVQILSYAVLDALGLGLTLVVARHRAVVNVASRVSIFVEIPLYVALSVVIMWQCHWW
jgi:cadmium resistance protein CadD (predicted permease)